MSYSQRYCTPSPLFPQPSPVSLERLLQSWEALRALDVEGYRTSHAQPMSTWLVDIQWADGRSVRSPGGGTTCSPFTTQAVAMAYSPAESQPLRPLLASGEPLSFLFSRAANGTLAHAPKHLMERYGMTLADNGWPRPVIFFNMGYAVEPTQLRRGDAVHLDWMSGGGHAVFCWDVHLNERGEVDAFQYVSSNGRIQVNGTQEGAGLGISVGGTPSGEGGLIRQVSADPIRYQVLRTPLFTDDERYVAEGSWVTWNPRLKLSDLTGCRTRPRGRLAYARVVHAARFHGVTPPPPFAMAERAADAQQQIAVPGADAAGAAADACAEQRLLQKQLKLLHAAGWIKADPGESDGRPDACTRAAVRAFQSEYRLKPDGIAGPKTRAKLREIYEAAALSPAGREYLATGAVAPRRDEEGSVSFAAGPADPVVRDFYFRHGTAAPGAEVEVILEAEGLDEVPLALYLRDVETHDRYEMPAPLVCTEGRGSVHLLVPAGRGARPPRQLRAGLAALGHETTAPLYVAAPARDQPSAQPVDALSEQE